MVVDKPAGWTSHQVVGRARRLLGTRKVGHAGTLDPMATGVLVVGVGRATRLLGHLMRGQKEYLATIRFGIGTDSDDADGTITRRDGAAGLTGERVDAALPPFRGAISQRPSAVSAIKVDGVRAYTLARSGDAPELAPREVVVERFELLAVRSVPVDGLPVLDADVRVVCSAGTYVRALARDIGTDLGVGAHLTALRRTRVGAFGLDEAVRLTGEDSDPVGVGDLLPLEAVVARCLPTLVLGADRAGDVRVGRRLVGLGLTHDPTALLGPDGEFLALYRPDGPDAVARAVFVGS